MDVTTNASADPALARQVRSEFLRSLTRLGRRRRADLFAVGLWTWLAVSAGFWLQRLVRGGVGELFAADFERQVGFVLLGAGPPLAFVLAHLASSRRTVVRGLDRELSLRGALLTCFEAPGGSSRLLNLLLTRSMVRELAPARVAQRLASSDRARAVRRRRARRILTLFLLLLLLLFLAMLLLPPLGPEGLKPHGELGSATASANQGTERVGEGREQDGTGAGTTPRGLEPEEGPGSRTDVEPPPEQDEPESEGRSRPERITPDTRETWLLPLRESAERSGRREELYVVAGEVLEREGAGGDPGGSERTERFLPRTLVDLQRSAENAQPPAGLDAVERAWIREYFALLREL